MNCRKSRDAWLRKGWGWWGAAALALVVGNAPFSLLPAQEGGQPARAVRLSYVDGTATLTQGGQVIASQAVANTPLLEGMQLATAQDGRAEVQLEDGSVARIAPNSTLTLKVLRGQGASGDAALELNRGLGYFELEGTDQIGQIRVLFGNSAATASGFTVMRVNMDAPPGELAVFSGNAHLEGDDGLALDLHGGESVALDANSPGNYNLADTIEPDSWDTWNSDRDQALNAESASQTGAQAELGGGDNSNPAWNDLDNNGNWYNVPGQGYVWSPYDAANAGFDPYGVGNWMWMPSFGYTWVSGYPWGYLPFSCGAWNFYGGFGWGWAPGFGGCTPWWGLGFYPGAAIGIAPIGYRPPHRPIVPRPIRPGGPGFPGGRHLPMPMVPVNRRPMVLNAGLPARDRSTPVEIAGCTVTPLRPLPGREMPGRAGYEHGAGFASQGFMGTPGRGVEGARPGFTVTRPVYRAPRDAAGRGYSAPYRGYAAPPVRTYSPFARTYSPPARTYSAPAPRSYSAPRSAPAPSGGGGFHGGGGGGGGGAHGGGGGGGSRH